MNLFNIDNLLLIKRHIPHIQTAGNALLNNLEKSEQFLKNIDTKNSFPICPMLSFKVSLSAGPRGHKEL